MPSIILSDNGVSSGSAGLKETAASDGALALQTTTAGGVATTALSISNTQVVTYANQPVYTGGTANGVAYLNGSKVLTTGSALTFDGSKVEVSNGTVRASNTGGYYTNLTATGLTNSATTMDFDSVSSYLFKIATAEQMRLTSTGLGIGTSSPTQKLTINGNANLIASDSRFLGGDASGRLLVSNSSTSTYMGLYGASASTPDVINFVTNSANVLTYDKAGNLGLGVTPSAWSTSRKVLQGTGAALMLTSGNNSLATLFANTYENTSGAYTYQNTAAASYYQQYNGAHSWYTAASGTAGNAISFTQAMTLDASGNLLVGTTSANTYGGRPSVQIGQGTDGGVLNFQGGATSTTNAAHIRINTSGTTVTDFVIETRNQAGTSSTPIVFKTQETERARIDSSGNLLVGTTSNPAGVKLVIGGTSGTARIEPVTDNVGYIGEGSYRWQAVYAVNGTIQTSDGREKNTIADSNLGLSFVQSLRPVSYKWNVGENVVTYDDEGKEVVTPRVGVRTHYGFIAQEVKAAIPEGVDFGGFVQEPNEGMMSLRYHEFIGPLVKAMQEQQAIIEDMKTRLAAAGI